MTDKHHQTRPEDIVPLKQKMALGAGGFPFQNGNLVVQYMAQPIFQIFLGLNPALFGLAMTIPRVWDAFTDPIMGRISDRHQSKWGRRRPFVFLGAILMAVTFASIWFVPQAWGEIATFWWLVTTSILFFTSYTIFSVPCYALACEVTPDYHERTRVMFYWALMFNIGNLCINWYTPLTTWAIFDGNQLIGARWVGIIVGVFVFFGLASLPAFFARDRFYKVAQQKIESNDVQIGFFKALAQAASSRHMVGLVGVVLALNFCATIAGSIALYIVIYYVKSGDVAGGITLNAMNGTGFAIVGFAGIFALRSLALKFGKRMAMYLVLILTTVGGVAKFFIFTPDMPYLLLLDSVLNGPVWVSLGVIIPSMVADLCDWDELKNGERREGIISAVFTWINKLGTSLTFLVSGIALTLSGFDEALGADQPEGTILIMRLVFMGASVMAPVLAMIFLGFYGITEKRAYEIRAELELRRGRV